MLNCISVSGRLVRDPELRRTAAGKAVTSFTLACDRDFKNQQTGEKEVDFLDCVAWGSSGENVAKAVLDACNGIAYKDDAAVVGLSICKRYGTRPCVVVQLSGEVESQDTM